MNPAKILAKQQNELLFLARKNEQIKALIEFVKVYDNTDHESYRLKLVETRQKLKDLGIVP